MILNLIIPVYNDYDGLIKTIMSIGLHESKHDIKLIVVNDCSTDGKNYKHIGNLFKPFYDIQIYKTPYNVGAGNARQYGLDKVNDNYVMFLDAGDVIYSSTEFIEYLNFVENNPQTLLFSPQHFEQRDTGEYVTHSPRNNRLHGKIYQVSFLKKYNIKFCKEFPNLNEDIGFNMLCRFHCKYLQSINPNIQYCMNYNMGITVWTFDINSLTRKDDYAFYYKQNMGISKNVIHAITCALEHGIPIESMREEITEVLVNLYIYYIGTMNQREEYLEEAFNGALEFYKQVLIPYSINEDLLIHKYNSLIGALLTSGDTAFSSKLPRIGILDFLLMLDNAYQSLNQSEGDNDD